MPGCAYFLWLNFTEIMNKKKIMNNISKKSVIVSLLFLLLISSFATLHASHKIKVMALFTNKAVLVVDGRQKLLKKGQTFQGVKLISSDSNAVVLQLHGEKQTFKLGSEISTGYKQADPGKELIVWKDISDMFRIHGSINNFSAQFLIDTGASSIALNSNTAKRIGLKYRQGTPMQASTASGIAKGYRVTLNKVKIGHIQLYNIDAVVLEGAFPTEVLLGQTFLSRIHMTRDGDKMKLRKKF